MLGQNSYFARYLQNAQYSPGQNLLMHVIKQFTAPVFVYDVQRSVERIDQMPMPMMKVDTDVLAEIADSVLGVQIVGRIIVWYLDRGLIQR